ncbi:hypothetical protein [Micromonospora endolithica]|uniref:Uncharacterized protein n=1 Tax=Micromonospora endolithica TaxID=230091 RepID=A0A3A9YT75_9ACTN|nr:hypothetical protein [Micromonospora endolithica]RKN38456.1 hypothetical protein D7223_31110 [Micromonospora endolithica]TWJ23124.1 hypothetical protein JD76_03253 [Micromonospora endolithica]
MAQASENTTGAGNTAVPHQGDHDRVAMLSLRADGVPDQHNPEIIGEKEFAVEATKRQFREQAVSAADVAARGAVADTGAEQVEQDPEIAKLQKEHEKVASSAESVAEKTVDALFTSASAPEPGAQKADTAERRGSSGGSTKGSR